MGRTDLRGLVGEGPGFVHGPDLRSTGIPDNPVASMNGIRAVAEMPAVPTGREAWIDCPARARSAPTPPGTTGPERASSISRSVSSASLPIGPPEMELHRLQDAPPFQATHVFREGHLPSLITTTLLALIAGVVVWMLRASAAAGELDAAGLFLGGLIALVCGLGALAYGALFVSTFGRQNWLMRYGPNGLMIKLRSYQNGHLPDDHPTLALLRPDEIAAVRVRTETHEVPYDRAGAAGRRAVFLDIELHEKDTTALLAAVEAETQARPPRRRLVASRDKHVRVYVPERGVVRIPWRGSVNWTTPGIARARRILGATLPVGESEARRTDWRRADEGREIEEHLADLCEQGDMITAMAIARRRYGMNLSDARRFIEEIDARHAPA
jgi:hypothetical protein